MFFYKVVTQKEQNLSTGMLISVKIFKTIKSIICVTLVIFFTNGLVMVRRYVPSFWGGVMYSFSNNTSSRDRKSDKSIFIEMSVSDIV